MGGRHTALLRLGQVHGAGTLQPNVIGTKAARTRATAAGVTQAHCSCMGGRGVQLEGVSGNPTGAGGNVAVQPAG